MNPEQVREVLERVNKHFVANSEWCRGSTAYVEKDKGPRDAKEFRESLEYAGRVRASGGELGEVLPHEYNGERGGRVFKWFAVGMFERELAKRGADRETCNERQATEALRATSAQLGEHVLWEKGRLVPFAGPQCYPQVKCLRAGAARVAAASGVAARPVAEEGGRAGRREEVGEAGPDVKEEGRGKSRVGGMRA